MKRVLKDGKDDGQGYDGDGAEATVENPTAGLVGHADGLEAGGSTRPSSSSAHPKPGGDGSQSPRRADGAIPSYSDREEQVVRLSKRLLNVFYVCGAIFAGPCWLRGCSGGGNCCCCFVNLTN